MFGLIWINVLRPIYRYLLSISKFGNRNCQIILQNNLKLSKGEQSS